MWDLSSPTRDRACITCILALEVWNLNCWTTREVLEALLCLYNGSLQAFLLGPHWCLSGDPVDQLLDIVP